MIRLVLTDMDMTLLAPDTQVSDRALAAIHRLVEKGVCFGPASGRDWDSVLESFRGDETCMRTALLSNGKKIYAGGELVREVPVERKDLVTMARMVHDLPGVYTSGRGDEGGFISGSTMESLIGTTWGSRRANELVEPDDIPTFPIITAGLHFEEGSEAIDNNLWADRIRAACPNIDLISPGSRMFDVVPKGWSKASGLEYLEEVLGIGRDEVVCFGDSDNDAKILSSVTHSVAVSNANDLVRGIARHHIASCYEDAVGHALEDIAELDEGAFRKWDE